jgi:hypothetical protein
MKANQVQRKAAGASDIISVDLGNNLATGETVSSATVANGTLTLGSPTINTAIVEIDGRSVPIGEAVQFSCSGGTAGTYTITLTYSTSSGRTGLELDMVLVVDA